MKAMTYDGYGDPDVLQLTEQPTPKGALYQPLNRLITTRY